MKWKCFFFGCCWSEGLQVYSLGERMLLQYCQRCHSKRTRAE